MRESKVFVSQDNPKHNFAEAGKYGDIVFMHPIGYNFPKVYNAPSQAQELKAIEEKLMEFDPETDYLLLTGCPVLMTVIGHLVFKMARGQRVKMLQWASRKLEYTVVTVCI